MSVGDWRQLPPGQKKAGAEAPAKKRRNLDSDAPSNLKTVADLAKNRLTSRRCRFFPKPSITVFRTPVIGTDGACELQDAEIQPAREMVYRERFPGFPRLPTRVGNVKR